MAGLPDDSFSAGHHDEAEAGGLCLPHLRLALERVRGEETAHLLRRLERDCYTRLLRDLDTLISRLDFYRR